MKKNILAVFMMIVSSTSLVINEAQAVVFRNNATETAMPAPNDGRYMRTQYSVTIYSETGVCKRTYAIYLYQGKKHIDFNNTWICIQGKSRFGYCGVWYIIK